MPCDAMPCCAMRCSCWQVFCHAGCTPAVVERLVCTLDKKGAKVDGPPPRALCSNGAAALVLRLERPACLELFADCRSMGRLVLREAGRTLAAGVVTALLP